MNKKLIGFLLALSIPLTASAEMGPPDDANNPHGPRIERMTKELNLSEDQKTKVQAIFDQQKQKLKAIHEETRTSLQGVLTPEQMTKFDEMRKQHRQLRGQKGGNKPQ